MMRLVDSEQTAMNLRFKNRDLESFVDDRKSGPSTPLASLRSGRDDSSSWWLRAGLVG